MRALIVICFVLLTVSPSVGGAIVKGTADAPKCGIINGGLTKKSAKISAKTACSLYLGELCKKRGQGMAAKNVKIKGYGGPQECTDSNGDTRYVYSAECHGVCY